MIRSLLRTIKPALLLLNAWSFKRSEEQLAYLNSAREGATAALRREHEHQVRLRAHRERIARL